MQLTGSRIPLLSNQSGSSQSFPMSNILPSVDRLCNLLISYPLLSPSLPIHLSPPSSSSMYLTKGNRERADSLDPMVGILDSKTPIETTRRNALMVLGAERLNNSGKVREIKHLPLPSPMMMLSSDSLPSPNLQTVYNSWIPLWTFQRTPRSLYTLLQHLPSDLPPSRKLLTPSHSLSGWVLRSHLRLSRSWIQSQQRSPRPILISIPHVITLLHLLSNP